LSVVYDESRKREAKIRLIHEGRCDERLKARVEEDTCLTHWVARQRGIQVKFICIRIKTKEEAKGKKCHAKTMWSLEKPI
jgi:hypothetical protein